MIASGASASRRRNTTVYGTRTVTLITICAFALGAFLGGSLSMHGSTDFTLGGRAVLPRRLALSPSPAIGVTNDNISPPAASTTPVTTTLSDSVAIANATVSRDLVICLAEGREYVGAAGLRWLTRFGGSFRRFNADADIVFITSYVNESIAPHLVDVRMTPLLFGSAPEPWQSMEVATRRWYLIRRYLDEHAAEYAGRWVLAIDARDTFFQSDPFAWPRNPGDELYVVTEGRGEAIMESDWNTKVLAACYDSQTLAPIMDKPVSCSGTVMGSYDGMLKYLRLMESEILATASNAVCQETGGRDQGFHQMILYGGTLTRTVNVSVFDNPTGGLVRTLRAGELYRDLLGRVLTDRGEVASIVHQWDRSYEIHAIIDRVMFPYMAPADIVLPQGYPDRRRSRAELVRDVAARGVAEAAARGQSAYRANGSNATDDEAGTVGVARKVLRNGMMRRDVQRVARPHRRGDAVAAALANEVPDGRTRDAPGKVAKSAETVAPAGVAVAAR